MSKHTPAPWGRTNMTVHTQSTAEMPSCKIAQVFDAPETDAVESVHQATANANLIMAAPEMYEVIEDLLNCCELNLDEMEDTTAETILMTKNVLAKINGESIQAMKR